MRDLLLLLQGENERSHIMCITMLYKHAYLTSAQKPHQVIVRVGEKIIIVKLLKKRHKAYLSKKSIIFYMIYKSAPRFLLQQ